MIFNYKKDIVFRCTIIVNETQKMSCSLIDSYNELCDEERKEKILEYVYSRYSDLQPDISKYTVEKLFTPENYAKIMHLATYALQRSLAYQN
jgi:hypothetical protein